MNVLEKATFSFQNQLPFVVYAKPNETTLCGVFPKDAVLNVFENQSGFVFASFYHDTNVVFPLSDSEIFQEEMNLEIEENLIHIDSKSDVNTQISFENLVRNGVSEIEKETFKKVVLSRKIEVSQSVDVIKSYQKLLKKYPTAFRYLWFHPKVGLWMGATPEQLAKIKNNTFETVALAGTQVFSSAITWQEKEIVEQQLVTDYIKNRTENLVEDLKISDSYTQKAGNLVHLKSDISGKLKHHISEIDIINALHPTSAVCGMPLEAARNFILENENYNRKYYSGFLGEFQMHEQTNLFVNLRCCEFVNTNTNTNVNLKNQSKVNIYVGCGITKESQAEKEFIETENKAKTILSVLCYS
ncbi:isochorismate synthase [Flavobacterium facile]|uniref:isochorismate synthase n=1 Tax=Flavobacterium facile TaxID=2893174 RepID=UPI002E78D55B|nr:isochorismate synthase [Flavobacterium sp. T-12]